LSVEEEYITILTCPWGDVFVFRRQEQRQNSTSMSFRLLWRSETSAKRRVLSWQVPRAGPRHKWTKRPLRAPWPPGGPL